jgi:hypothetical protein
VKEKNRQEIFIEKGMADRQRIVLTGAGDQEVHYAASVCRFYHLADLCLAWYACGRCDICPQSQPS